jgi:hypothetical protein
MLDAVEMTVRMIRSKGIGVFFVTQNPTDLPDGVLSQLGNRVQHALRAFTPNDEQALRATADTFPTSSHYDVRAVIQGLGTGEALVTVLDPDGSPSPTVATRMVAPRSTMDPISAELTAEIATQGDLGDTYADELDRESAHEVLAERQVDEAADGQAQDTGKADAPEPVPAEGDHGASPADGPADTTPDRAPAPDADRPLLSTSGWKTVEDIAAAVTPHGHKGLVRRGVKVLRGFLGNRRR